MGGLSAQQIYDNFHLHATGPDALYAAQQSAYRLAGAYQDRAVATQKLIDGIRSGWTGQAAEAASQGLAPLAENSLQRGDDLNTAQDLVFRQTASWHTAAAKVQPVPPAPQFQNVIAVIASGQLPQPMLDQLQRYNSVAQTNVDAYQQYVDASQYNASTLPANMASVAVTSAPVAAVTPTAPASTGGSTAGQPTGHGSPGPVGHGSSGGPPARQISPASQPTSPGSQGSGASATAGLAPASAGTDAGTGAQSIDQVPVVTTSSSAPVLPASTPGPTGGGAAHLPGGGFGPADRWAIAPGHVGGGTEVGAPGGGRAGSGGAAAALASERAAEAGTAGGSELVGGPLGGHGAAGDQDAEHKRKYKYGPDPHSTFGVAEMVAPPVFGESAAERQARATEGTPPP